MGFIDFLRKLGIFRSGLKIATYKNAKERPIEHQDSSVFDSEKDLLNSKK